MMDGVQGAEPGSKAGGSLREPGEERAGSGRNRKKPSPPPI